MRPIAGSATSTHGYAVVRGVLSPDQTAEAMRGMWSLMESLGTVRRDQPKSPVPSASWPPMLHGGMIQYLGHTPLQWSLRALCASVFARYYDVPADQLATSFDGLCMMHGARRYQKRGDLTSFLHTDQSPTREGEWSIQGLINLADSGPDDGGLVAIPGTHLTHRRFFEGHPHEHSPSNWYKFRDAEKAPLAAQAVKVDAEPGDFLLWDSRTFHCNTVPVRTDAIRACAYVCMLPHERIPAHIRHKRQQAFEQRRTSSHHPGDGFKMFPQLPRFVTDRARFLIRTLALQEPELSPLQEALLCGG
jgi:hypothetical protein